MGGRPIAAETPKAQPPEEGKSPMKWNASSIENLRRVFAEGFAARDIAEPLVSFDASTSTADALKLMTAEDFDVVGVRRESLVVG